MDCITDIKCKGLLAMSFKNYDCVLIKCLVIIYFFDKHRSRKGTSMKNPQFGHFYHN